MTEIVNSLKGDKEKAEVKLTDLNSQMSQFKSEIDLKNTIIKKLELVSFWKITKKIKVLRLLINPFILKQIQDTQIELSMARQIQQSEFKILEKK